MRRGGIGKTHGIRPLRTGGALQVATPAHKMERVWQGAPGPGPPDMPQTLLALAAIFAFAFLALGRQRHDNDVERRAISVETEQAAADVARSRMSDLSTYAFDEQDVGRTGIRTQPSSAALGPDAGESSASDYDDVDDWNGFATGTAVAVGADSLRFAERVAVQYVRNEDPSTPSASATLTKEVLVEVTEVLPLQSDRPPVVVRLRRVVTPAGAARLAG